MAKLTDAQKLIAQTMSETELQNNIVHLFQTYHWLVHAEIKAQKKDGRWHTAIQGDAGYPDLTASRFENKHYDLLIIELKSEKGKLSKEQQKWRDNIPRGVYHLWRPSDWLDGTIEEMLK